MGRARTISRRCLGLLALCLWWACCHAPPAHAADNLRVLLVLSDNNALYQRFAATFKQNLPANIQVALLERAEDFSGSGPAADLILAVGSKAAESLAAKTTTPMLAAMIPRSKFADLLAKHPGAAPTAAIYLDHSWARQADLLHAALPERSRVGVLHSPATRLDVNELRKQLARHGATLLARQTTTPAKLFDDLEEVLSHSDILLAVPDGEIYNSNNIRNILLSSYSHGVPLVGFSQALVNAGALLALFSTPEQLAAQASSATIAYAQQRRLPDSQFPLLYSIAVNQEVARTLGGAVKSAELLRLQVDKLQKPNP